MKLEKTNNFFDVIENSAPPIDILASFTDIPPELDFVLPGMITGTVGSIVAQGGVGKSWLALEIASAVAGASDLLNLGIRKSGRVLYLPAEDPLEAVQLRLHQLGPYLNREDREAFIENLTVRPLMGIPCDIMRQDVANAITRLGEGSRLIVLDTLRRFHNADENAGGPMAELLGVVERICNRTGASILFLHHTAKSASLNGGGGEQQASRGSSVLVDNIRGGQLNLCVMSEAEAERNKIDSATRKRFVKLVQAKSNFGPPMPDRWLERGGGGILLPKNEIPAVTKNPKNAGRRMREVER